VAGRSFTVLFSNFSLNNAYTVRHCELPKFHINQGNCFLEEKCTKLFLNKKELSDDT
jgi:hypothetical protein